MIRFISFVIMSCMFGISQAVEPTFHEDVLSETMIYSITDFIREVEKDKDIKLELDTAESYYAICLDGLNPTAEKWPDAFKCLTFVQSNRNVCAISDRYKKYFKNGVYVIFPYQELSDDKITVTVTLKNLILDSKDCSIEYYPVISSQYVYTLCEYDLSWHFTQKNGRNQVARDKQSTIN